METAIVRTKTLRRSRARAAGTVYLGYFVAAILGSILESRKMAGGVAVNALSDVLYATMTILLWRILRPVSGLLATIAALLSLAGCITDLLHQIHRGPAGLDALVFFGPFCVLLGVLIWRARFLPRWLGSPLMLAGAGWLAYLIPAVAHHAKSIIFPVGFLAELALMLWLLVKGVDEDRWRNSSAAIR